MVEDLRLGVENFENPLGGSGGTFQILGQGAQLIHRLVEHHHVGNKGLQIAQSQGILQHPAATKPPQDHRSDGGDKGDRRHKIGPHLDRLHSGLTQFRTAPVKAINLAVLLGKCFDHLGPGNGIGQMRVEHGDASPDPVKDPVDAPGVK